MQRWGLLSPDCDPIPETVELPLEATSELPETVTHRPRFQKKVAHFELKEQLGAGGFGVVWRAEDTRLDRSVALKIPHQSQLTQEESEKFLREARAAAQLKHPNIVSVHEVGRDNESVYIVNDYIEGISLADWLTGQQPTVQEAVQWSITIAEALHHAHEQRVIHRDLKPHNILLDQNGQPHVMDFGLARREVGEVTVTRTGDILGTPAYMSPEQAQGQAHQADRRTDLYSLGVILFELLTGERPFRGNTRMLIFQIIHEEAPQLRQLNRQIPRALETICLKCLEREPKKRFQTAQELANELRRFQQGDPIHSRPVGLIERKIRWCRKNPVLASMGTILVLVLIAGSVVSTIFGLKEQQSRKQVEQEQKKTTAAFRRLEEEQQRTADALTAEMQARQEAQHKQRLLEQEQQKTTSALQQVKSEQQKTATALDVSKVNELRADWEVYAQNITLAQAEWERGNAELAWHYLNQCRWDFRDWEHDYLHTLFTNNSSTFSGHTETVRDAKFSPDGKLLATASNDKTVKIWDLATGKELRTCTSHREFVVSVNFSPNGKYLASGSWDNRVKLWNVQTGQEIRLFEQKWGRSRFTHIGNVRCVCFSPDSRQLATAGDERLIRLWDVQTGEELRTFKGHQDAVTCVCFSPDGQSMASSSWNKTIRLWETATGKRRHLFSGHTGSVFSVCFSPNGRQLASSSDDGTAKRLSENS